MPSCHLKTGTHADTSCQFACGTACKGAGRANIAHGAFLLDEQRRTSRFKNASHLCEDLRLNQ